MDAFLSVFSSVLLFVALNMWLFMFMDLSHRLHEEEMKGLVLLDTIFTILRGEDGMEKYEAYNKLTGGTQLDRFKRFFFKKNRDKFFEDLKKIHSMECAKIADKKKEIEKEIEKDEEKTAKGTSSTK